MDDIDGAWVRWLLGGLGGLITLMFGEMIRRLFKLVDGKANKDSVDRRFDEVQRFLEGYTTKADARFEKHMEEDRAYHIAMGAKLDRTNEHLSTTNTTLAALAGRFQGMQERNGDRQG